MEIKTSFMKTILSRLITKQMKKFINGDCGVTLYDLSVTNSKGKLYVDVSMNLTIREEDLKKFLIDKDII